MTSKTQLRQMYAQMKEATYREVKSEAAKIMQMVNELCPEAKTLEIVRNSLDQAEVVFANGVVLHVYNAFGDLSASIRNKSTNFFQTYHLNWSDGRTYQDSEAVALTLAEMIF